MRIPGRSNKFSDRIYIEGSCRCAAAFFVKDRIQENEAGFFSFFNKYIHYLLNRIIILMQPLIPPDFWKIVPYAFSVLAFLGLAQDSSIAQTYFGVKAGPNISHLLMTKIPNEFGDSSLGQLYGFQAGVVAEQPIGKHLVLGVELLGARKGGRWSLAPIGDPFEEETISDLYYLNLPIFFRLIPIERWSMDIGIEGGYLLGSSEEALFMERADFAWLLGASFHLSRSILASLRYSLGNVRVGEGHFLDEDTGINGVYYFRTRSLQLSVAYFW